MNTTPKATPVDLSAAPSRTLGPISDLERHLPSEWWRSLFNAVYLKTDGDVVENETATAAEVDVLIQSLGLEPNDRLLDLCCGQGRHCLELARRGFRKLTGIDRSGYLIRLARKRARQAGLDVKFREGDARKVSVPEHSFDVVVMMGNSFGYFDREEDDLGVLTAVKRALASKGRLAIDLTDGDWMRQNFEPRSWEWIDQNQFVCRERSLSGDGDRLISREVVVHAERGVIADQFYAERLYSRERIRELLDKAGFEAIRFHEVIEGQSDRGADLGMMARRFFLTCQAPRIIAKRRGKAERPAEVTVVLGDPRLPDSVKLEGVFNQDDLATVDRLKAALAEIPGIKASYLDNHASLMADLKSRRPGFVLNLCDEGYNNDALMELHVPAMLEMLGIPYSGAGPAALGLCYNKALVRAIAAAADVPVPLETYFAADDQAATIPSIFPALIKPCLGDSSIGITKEAVVQDPVQAIAYLDELRNLLPGRPVLVQEFLSGAEYSVSLIGNPGLGLTVLPILEVDYSGLDEGLPKILGYESKWDPASPYWTEIAYKEATLGNAQQRNLVTWSSLLFERLGCRDYARFDFRADAQGRIKLLEVNPNPGWCWDGKVNLMASMAGHRYADLLQMIIEAAWRRTAQDQALHAPSAQVTAA
ncbi:MAG: methyltransferase domain-containing protein [Alphaproteobacteria bacterium]